MRVESLTVLHYGKAYLRFALKSILDHVDRAHIVYCPRPSHGHWTDDPCPDTRQDLLDAVAGLPRAAREGRVAMRRIGILTGGGDCPGLNAVIRAVVKTANRYHGMECYGLEDAYEGLVEGPHVQVP